VFKVGEALMARRDGAVGRLGLGRQPVEFLRWKEQHSAVNSNAVESLQ
jgi:hypothetical protein